MDEKNLQDSVNENEVPASETPATETPVTEAPVEETPVQEAPAQEASAQEAPAPAPAPAQEEVAVKKATKKPLAILAIAFVLALALIIGAVALACNTIFAKEPESEEQVSLFTYGLLAVAQKQADGKEKWGYIDEKGKTVIDFQFDDAEPFHTKKYAQVQIGEKYYVINRKGEIVSPAYDHMYSFAPNGTAVVSKLVGDSMKYGYINKKGEMIIDYIFDGANTFTSYDRAVARSGEKYGVINKKGEWVIEAVYAEIELYDEEDGMGEIDIENVAVLKNAEDKIALTNKNGEIIVDFGTYKSIRPVGKYYPVEKEQTDGTTKWGYIDHKGKEVIACAYTSANFFVNGRSSVANEEGKYALINEKGEPLTSFFYVDIGEMNEKGFAVVCTVGTDSQLFYSVMNKKGEVLENVRNYDSIDLLEGGLLGPIAVVEKDGKYGVVNRFGDVMINPTYEDYLQPATPDGKWFFVEGKDDNVQQINKKGEEVHNFTNCMWATYTLDEYYVTVNGDYEYSIYTDSYKLIGTYAQVNP